jgi:hypothetical protein
MAASDETRGDASEDDETTKPGPPNPQGSGDLDMPSPPGGPLRSDAPSGAVPPGGPGTPAQPGEPKEVERPQRPVKEPGSDTDPSTSALETERNAQTSQGEPSDDSGSE